MHMIMKCDRIFLNNANVNILKRYVAQEKRKTAKKCLFYFYAVNMNRFYLF